MTAATSTPFGVLTGRICDLEGALADADRMVRIVTLALEGADRGLSADEVDAVHFVLCAARKVIADATGVASH